MHITHPHSDVRGRAKPTFNVVRVWSNAGTRAGPPNKAAIVYRMELVVCKTSCRDPPLVREAGFGGGDRNRTDGEGFADLCLTAWLRRPRLPASPATRGPPRLQMRDFSGLVRGWSGKRDSNPRLQPWQGCTLPLSYSRSRGELKQSPTGLSIRAAGAANQRIDANQPPGLKASSMCSRLGADPSGQVIAMTSKRQVPTRAGFEARK